MFEKQNLKPLFFNMLLSCMGIFVALIVTEGVMRIFTPGILQKSCNVRTPMYALDSDLGWKLKPNFIGIAQKKEFLTQIRINKNGFRDMSRSLADCKTAFKILGLGDSMTFGYGVEREQAYLKLLEKNLNDSRLGGRNYCVFNTGVPGYSLKEYAIFLTKSWRMYEPDLVTIGITINDHTDIQSYPKYDVVEGYIINHQARKANPVSIDPKSGRPILSSPTSPFMKFKVFLAKHSYLYCFVEIATRNLGARRYQLGEGETELVVKEVEDAWRKASKRLDQIRNLCRENDIELLILFIPHRSQVQPGLSGDRRIIEAYFEDLDERLEIYCKKYDIPFINMYPYLVKGARQGECMYFQETDAHWNSNGHVLAAQVMYDFIKRKIVLKGKGDA